MSKPFTVDVHGLKNFSEKERQKFSLAMKELERVVSSPAFKEAILAHNFDDQTNGKTNQELYDDFMNGSDKFNQMNDRDMDVHLTMFYSWKSTIGYTYPSTWWTWINRKFFKRFGSDEIAMNVTHEDRHNDGYDHRSARDHDSVPYAFGYIVRDLIRGIVPPVSYTNRRRKPVRKRRSFMSRVRGFFRRLF